MCRCCLAARCLGQIYLTDKEDYPEFTQDDERVIETLAAYAAVAIGNARLYEDLLTRDKAVTQRNRDLALLNAVGEMLASTLNEDEILEKTLAQVMEYLQVEAGEIFLATEDGQSLMLALHRGEAAEAFWTKERFDLGEGFIGIAAETGKPVVTTFPERDTRYLRLAVVEAGFRCIGLHSTGRRAARWWG